MEVDPIIYDEFKLKNEVEAKHLGEFIHQGGNNKSILSTIEHRRGRVTKSIFEIAAVLKDVRMESIGGILCGITIWEMAVLPYLLNNSETWENMEDDCIQELEKLQTLFMSVLWEVPVTCARPALTWDTATLSMQNRII